MLRLDAWRPLRASPATTVAALLVLSAGIAAATIVFSLVDAVVLRSLPFERSDRIVVVERPAPAWPPTQSAAVFEAWRTRAAAFEAVAGTSVGPMAHLPAADGVSRTRAWEITASLFDVLAVRPVLGRVFTAENERPGRNDVAVISHGVWVRNFGGDPDIVGRSIVLADRRNSEQPANSVEIVGVLPPGVTFPFDVGPGMWIPHVLRRNGDQYLQVIGRLRDSASLEEAAAQLQTIAASVETAGGRVLPESRRPVPVLLYDTLVREVKRWMLIALALAALTLLVSCGNVAILMLVRAGGRARELAIRASLGAPRGRCSPLAGRAASSAIASLLFSGSPERSLDVLCRRAARHRGGPCGCGASGVSCRPHRSGRHAPPRVGSAGTFSGGLPDPAGPRRTS